MKFLYILRQCLFNSHFIIVDELGICFSIVRFGARVDKNLRIVAFRNLAFESALENEADLRVQIHQGFSPLAVELSYCVGHYNQAPNNKWLELVKKHFEEVTFS
jgi:hypothetical protein